MRKEEMEMEKKYWNERYASGGTSGAGSVGDLRAFKWRVIDKHVSPLDCLIDLGCGDLRFWDGKVFTDYTGIDISDVIIERDRKIRPSWKFICSPAERLVPGLQSDNVFCLDMLFHIMKTNSYIDILRNISVYSNKMIFLYTWIRNPFTEKATDGFYQRYRPFVEFEDIILEHGFERSDFQRAPDRIGGMFVYQKV